MDKKVAAPLALSISVLGSLMGVQTASAIAPQPTGCVLMEDVNWQESGQNETGPLYLCSDGNNYSKIDGVFSIIFKY